MSCDSLLAWLWAQSQVVCSTAKKLQLYLLLPVKFQLLIQGITSYNIRYCLESILLAVVL